MYVFHPHIGKLWTTTIVVNKVHYHSTLSVIGFIGSWILTFVIILSIKLWLLFAIAIIFTNMRPSIILINKRSFYWYNQVFQILHWVVWFGQSAQSPSRYVPRYNGSSFCLALRSVLLLTVSPIVLCTRQTMDPWCTMNDL